MLYVWTNRKKRRVICSNVNEKSHTSSVMVEAWGVPFTRKAVRTFVQTTSARERSNRFIYE